jgi:hypothetical protein
MIDLSDGDRKLHLSIKNRGGFTNMINNIWYLLSNSLSWGKDLFLGFLGKLF